MSEIMRPSVSWRRRLASLALAVLVGLLVHEGLALCGLENDMLAGWWSASTYLGVQRRILW